MGVPRDVDHWNGEEMLVADVERRKESISARDGTRRLLLSGTLACAKCSPAAWHVLCWAPARLGGEVAVERGAGETTGNLIAPGRDRYVAAYLLEQAGNPTSSRSAGGMIKLLQQRHTAIPGACQPIL